MSSEMCSFGTDPFLPAAQPALEFLGTWPTHHSAGSSDGQQHRGGWGLKMGFLRASQSHPVAFGLGS